MSGIDPELLELLACPACRAALADDAASGELVCTGPGCGLVYPVTDGIPVLLVDKSRRPDDGRA